MDGTPWMQKPWLTIFRIAVIADLATRRQVPAPLGRLVADHLRPTFSRFRLYYPSVLPFLALNAQTGRFIVERATLFEGAIFAFCTCSNARFQICTSRFRGQDYFEAKLGTLDSLLPQDLVSADFFEGVFAIKRRRTWNSPLIQRWRIYPGRALERPSSKFVSFPVMSVANDFTVQLALLKLQRILSQSPHHFHPFSSDES